MDAGHATTIELLGALSPRDAVDRCGECHRRAEDFANAIDEKNKTIVRFAPVGLVQSPCFIKQATVVSIERRLIKVDVPQREAGPLTLTSRRPLQSVLITIGGKVTHV